MKKRLIILSTIIILFMSCICGGGQPAVIVTPTAPIKKLLLIFNGESNSGGQALNTSATSIELAPRPQVQILNNTSFLFEDLDIGTNNTIGHFGITCCTTHGWELEIANQVVVNPAIYSDTLFLIKTGQGGSQIDNWKVNCGSYCDTNDLYIGKFFTRVNSARTLINRSDIMPVIFLSIGINDAISGTQNDTFKNKLYRHINTLRAITRQTTPVIITKFSAGNTRYNNVFDSVANNMGLQKVYTIDATDATMLDAYHWNYSGLKTITNRLLNVISTYKINW